MKAFTQIARPHQDIVEGRLRMDVFAADLWRVAQGSAPEDYRDADLFFKKTYITKGLKSILEIAKNRLEGKTGDSTIQLQTPFGGGKTHTLIALYHKAKEWGAKVVVLDGSAPDAKYERLWEELERQLTGKIELTKGDIAPGKEVLIRLLSENSPVLILMDELLEYTTRAAGVKVGDSNLAAQTFAFIQELTGAVSTVGNSMLVLALPSSALEHYDENTERIFQKLQKITGRTEKIYTPVEDDEIESVVRARLFIDIDEKEAKKVVDDFVEYAKKEGLLSGNEASVYRERFLKSYPFKPEVVDTLYKKWGSFSTFQRTRGVLRILSLVVRDLLNKNIPFIRLGDFNIANQELRQELISYIGQEWDSIVAQDITSQDSGAKKVDEMLGASYLPYRLGTVVSTTIFMTSFSGRGEKGSSIKEIKLSAVEPSFSSAIIDTVVNYLKEKLFYLSDDGLFFTNQPNLNRLIVSREENVSDDEIRYEAEAIVRRHISNEKFKVYIHPKSSRDVADNEQLKLVILDSGEPNADFLEKHGDTPRIFRNTMIFLCVDDNHRESFCSYVRKLIALRHIEQDKDLKLSESQRNELKNKLKSHQDREYEELRKFYRKLFVPDKGRYKEFDMGLPTYGESKVDKEVYNYLRSNGEILEKISPKVIKDKYLAEKDFVDIRTLYESLLKTPGELRIISPEGLIEGLREGVKSGLFGFGYLEDGRPVCKSIKENPNITLSYGEIIIKPELCKEARKKEDRERVVPTEDGKVKEEETEPAYAAEGEEKKEASQIKTSVKLKLAVPLGQMSTVAKVVNYLKETFNHCGVQITIQASGGKISKSDYENRILEALKQAGIKIEEEE
ncbi:MAG: ATP-binding protein [Pseudothermotoga sp.]|nr:ATP-binding protein [Pseudothermotoga sp.]